MALEVRRWNRFTTCHGERGIDGSTRCSQADEVYQFQSQTSTRPHLMLPKQVSRTSQCISISTVRFPHPNRCQVRSLKKIRIVRNKHAGGVWMPSKTMLHATSIALLTGWNRLKFFWAESYGMNDVPRRWWNILDKALRSSGMVPTRADRFCCVLYSLQSRARKLGNTGHKMPSNSRTEQKTLSRNHVSDQKWKLHLQENAGSCGKNHQIVDLCGSTKWNSAF